jgi:hypothetical protein
MKITPIVWGLVGVLVFSSAVRAQSLADVARKEAERRKAIKAPAKVYTDDDLRRYPVTPPPEVAPADAEKPAVGDDKQAGGEGKPAAKPEAAAPVKVPEPSVDLGEPYWRKLITDARSTLARSASYLQGLQSRSDLLANEYNTREDSAQRNTIWAQRNRVIEDIERLKQDMADQEKAIAKVEADARKAGVPPGWIR